VTIDWVDPLAALQSSISGVSKVGIGNPGQGYTSPPSITMDPPSVGGVQATAIAVMGVGAVAVSSGGGGYKFPVAPTVTITGNGTGATATASLTPTGVASVAVASPGSLYTSPPTVQLSGGGGTGATATCTLSGGQVTGITVTNGGKGYVTTPNISIVGSGYGAQAVAIVEGSGAISSLSPAINFGGTYTSSPSVAPASGPAQLVAYINGTVTAINVAANVSYAGGCDGYTIGTSPYIGIALPDLPGGTPATATAQIVDTGGGFGGWLITLSPGSSGYSKAPAVVLGPPDDPGQSFGARQDTATAAISGPVEIVDIVYGGAGYGSSGSVALVFTGGGGTGASGSANYISDSIKAINVTSPGQGYATAPTVVIDPATGGSPVQATASATSTPVGVSSVNVISPGTGYSANPSVIFIGGGGSGAVATGTTPSNPNIGTATLNPTTVATVTVNTRGSGYLTPPTVSFSGGSGLGAKGSATLTVVSATMTAGGYQYAKNPVVTFASVDGNGSGANGSAYIPGLSSETFSIGQANALATELASVGETYAAGQPIPVAARTVSYNVPPTYNWLELDRATRYAASVSSSWFTWNTTWTMVASSDPTTVMVQRANTLSRALAARIFAGGTVDPFFANTWSPLYSLAGPAYSYHTWSTREQSVATTVPYSDNSPLAMQLLQLIAEAVETAAYLGAL
jgi:hypothetical protein